MNPAEEQMKNKVNFDANNQKNQPDFSVHHHFPK